VPVTEKTNSQLAFEKQVQQDYLSLTNPKLSPELRTEIINKYYFDVQRNKLDLSMFVEQRTPTPDPDQEEEEVKDFEDIAT
jgi:hypothetical protein